MILSWLAAYAIHSTILLAVVWLLTRFAFRGDAWRDTLWKAALLGGLITSTVQTGLRVPSLVGRWELEAASIAFEPRDVAREVAREELARSEHESHTALATDHAHITIPLRSTTIIPLAWGAIAIVLLARLARRQLRLHRLLRDRQDVNDQRLLEMLAELRRHAGVWRPVRLTAASRCATPLALGASEICVPERLVHLLPSEEQRGALAHELAHLARRDPWWQLTAGLIEAVFFFQPLNRVARLKLREAAEHLSDDWAVRHTGSALGLARCLAAVASWVVPGAEPVPQGTLAMAEGGSPLLRRVERLLIETGRPALAASPVLRVSAAALLLAVVVAAAPAVSRDYSVQGPTPSPSPSGSPSPSPSPSASPSPSRSERPTVSQQRGDTNPARDETLATLFRLAMEDPDARIRSDATEQMAAFAPAKVLPLLKRLAWEHRDLKTRREAVETMGEVRGTTALGYLDEIVARHPDDIVAAQAVETISSFPESLSVPRLRAIVQTSTRTKVRREAFDQLQDHNPDPNPPDDFDPNPNPSEIGGDPERVPVGANVGAVARRNADRFDKGADGAAVRRLAAGLDHTPLHEADLVRERATWALAQMDDEKLIGPLINALRDNDWRVRAYAAWALGVADDPRAKEPLRLSLTDSHWRVRMHAGASLKILETP